MTRAKQVMPRSAITERDVMVRLLAVFTMAMPKWAQVDARDRVLVGLVFSQ